MKRLIFMVICSCVFALDLARAQQDEKLTITTYYPSPTGVYNQLQAKRVVIGDVNADGQINSADVPATARPLFVQGSTTAITTAGFANAAGYGVGIGSADGLTVGAIQSHFYQNGVSSGPAPNLTINFGGGNVGIGTMTPEAKLVVVNSTTGSGIKIAEFLSPVNDLESNYIRVGRTLTNDGATFGYIFNSASNLAGGFIGDFQGNPKMYVNGLGNVGIGTTTPAYLLDVTDRIRVRQGASGTAGVWLYQNTFAANRAFVGMTGDDAVGFWGGGASAWGLSMNVTSLNVGIGTTNPVSKLQLANNVMTSPPLDDFSEYQILLYQGATAAQSYGIGIASSILWFNTHGHFVFGKDGVENFRINTDGNVGIGTSTPGADKLDVRGRAYASDGWQAFDADYAEWFEREEHTVPGDLIGVNTDTGKVRKYRPGDTFIGIHSAKPAVVGNRVLETDEEMNAQHSLVGLLGQVVFDRSQTAIRDRIVYTKDGKKIGVLLNNNKIIIGRN